MPSTPSPNDNATVLGATSSFYDIPRDCAEGLLAAHNITDDITACRGKLILLRHPRDAARGWLAAIEVPEDLTA